MSFCTTFWEILREAEEIIARAKKNPRYRDCEFFFRGEYNRFNPYGSSEPPPPGDAAPSLLRKTEWREHEHEIFHEAIRHFPEFFEGDVHTIDSLAKMQHHQVLTRLMDVSGDLRLSGVMATVPFASWLAEEHNEHNAFIHIYAVKKSRIKYSDSDIVTAIANGVKIPPKHLNFKNLNFLAYECKNDRSGFSAAPEEICEKLKNDLPHVWCVKPLMNTERIRIQSGCFFLFGFGDEKAPIKASFSPSDFEREDAASYGIERVNVITINGKSKKSVAHELSEFLGYADYQFYPGLSRFGYAYRTFDGHLK